MAFRAEVRRACSRLGDPGLCCPLHFSASVPAGLQGFVSNLTYIGRKSSLLLFINGRPVESGQLKRGIEAQYLAHNPKASKPWVFLVSATASPQFAACDCWRQLLGISACRGETCASIRHEHCSRSAGIVCKRCRATPVCPVLPGPAPAAAPCGGQRASHQEGGGLPQPGEVLIRASTAAGYACRERTAIVAIAVRWCLASLHCTAFASPLHAMHMRAGCCH
jgi:hypothetical protein